MKPGRNLKVEDLAMMIDHAVLPPDKTEEEVAEECRTAAFWGTATVCVRPYDIRQAAESLKASSPGVSAVVGFPHGTSVTEVKIAEAEKALEGGAVELDIVAPVGKIRSGAWSYLEQELEELTDLIHRRGAVLKIILENYYLTREEVIRCCRVCEYKQVDFVKTSTGFAPEGARLEEVRLMRETCSSRVQVKAAGGIRTLQDVLDFYDAGADRIGTSSTANILMEARTRE